MCSICLCFQELRGRFGRRNFRGGQFRQRQRVRGVEGVGIIQIERQQIVRVGLAASGDRRLSGASGRLSGGGGGGFVKFVMVFEVAGVEQERVRLRRAGRRLDRGDADHAFLEQPAFLIGHLVPGDAQGQTALTTAIARAFRLLARAQRSYSYNSY